MAGFLFSEVTKRVKAVIEGPSMLVVGRSTCFPSLGDMRPIVEVVFSQRQQPEVHEIRLQMRDIVHLPRQQPEDHNGRVQMREEIKKKRRDMEKLKRRLREMEKKKKSRESFLKHEKRREKVLAKLAHRTETMKMKGDNIGIFGSTSTGKSTMINSLLGKQIADTGVGETTREKRPYQGKQYTLWDTPGRNDESTYSNQKDISFMKGLTRRLVVIQCTIKENLKLMRLLDDLGLDYDIVVNKFDDVDTNERPKLQEQIQDEIRSLRLTQKKNVFFSQCSTS